MQNKHEKKYKVKKGKPACIFNLFRSHLDKLHTFVILKHSCNLSKLANNTYLLCFNVHRVHYRLVV